MAPGRAARSAAAAVKQSVVFAFRVALGTPLWGLAAAAFVAVYLERKGK